MSIEPFAPFEGEPRRLPPARPRSRPSAPPPPESLADDSGRDEHEPSYEVGYKRPPRHTQFQKGCSGNPAGRPRLAKGLKTIVRETMTAQVEVRTAAGARKMSRVEALMHKTVELAMKGNVRAMTELLSLYAAAVPDPMTAAGGPTSEEDLTATDLAMLEALRQEWAGEDGGAS